MRKANPESKDFFAVPLRPIPGDADFSSFTFPPNPCRPTGRSMIQTSERHASRHGPLSVTPTPNHRPTVITIGFWVASPVPCAVQISWTDETARFCDPARPTVKSVSDGQTICFTNPSFSVPSLCDTVTNELGNYPRRRKPANQANFGVSDMNKLL